MHSVTMNDSVVFFCFFLLHLVFHSNSTFHYNMIKDIQPSRLGSNLWLVKIIH